PHVELTRAQRDRPEILPGDGRRAYGAAMIATLSEFLILPRVTEARIGEAATKSMSGAVINDVDPKRPRSAILENNVNRNRGNVDSKEPKLDRRSVLGLAGAAISASA